MKLGHGGMLSGIVWSLNPGRSWLYSRQIACFRAHKIKSRMITQLLHKHNRWGQAEQAEGAGLAVCSFSRPTHTVLRAVRPVPAVRDTVTYGTMRAYTTRIQESRFKTDATLTLASHFECLGSERRHTPQQSCDCPRHWTSPLHEISAHSESVMLLCCSPKVCVIP